MDLAAEHVPKGLIDHAMSLQPAAPGKCFRLDANLKVPGTVACARVAGMPRAVIVHRYLCGGKGRLEPRLDPFN